MRIYILTILVLLEVAAIAGSVSTWKVAYKKDGVYAGSCIVTSGASKTLSSDNDEYPIDYSFPTNDPIYWKKVGNDIVAMTLAEQTVVNSNIQQNVTTATTGDAQQDAMLRTIAQAIANNEKTYEGVVAIFKGQVDPVKAKKEKSK